jgi:segregation and condensation protein A
MADPDGTGGKKAKGKRGGRPPATPGQDPVVLPETPAPMVPEENRTAALAELSVTPGVTQVSPPEGIPSAGSGPGVGGVADDVTRGSAGADGGAQEPPAARIGIVEDPVEILVGLAERGEIDPWNIDIIEVTDRFLSELEQRRELNLQLSGRTLFYAATLLRMKSEQLEPVTGENGDEEDGDGEGFGENFDLALDSDVAYEGRLGPIERLEHEIQRRLDRKTQRKSPITLFELITELKNIEKEERRRRRMASDPSDPSDMFLMDADEVVSIAHEEGFQESSLTRLEEYLEGLEIDEEMTLRELCERMEWRIPEVYIPLLFLALDGRCSLRQEEFFGDIWVQIRHPAEADPPAGSLAE